MLHTRERGTDMRKIGILIVMVILPIELFIAFAVWARTDVANYDVKLAHYQMDTKYCPYCGELLEEESDED